MQADSELVLMVALTVCITWKRTENLKEMNAYVFGQTGSTCKQVVRLQIVY